MPSASSFSLAYQEAVAPVGSPYMYINNYSTYKPNFLAPSPVSEWYGYSSTQSISIPFTTTGIHFRKLMYVVDLGATSTYYWIEVTASAAGLSSTQNAIFEGRWGWPFDSGGYMTIPSTEIAYTGFLGGNGNTTYYNYFYYEPGTPSGSLAYFYNNIIQDTSGWPTMSLKIGEIEQITIDVYGPSYGTCGQNYSFTAAASNAVSESVDVSFTWIGDLGGSLSGTITIPAGNSCASTSATNNLNCLGEFFSDINISIDPSNGKYQWYTFNSWNTTSPPC